MAQDLAPTEGIAESLFLDEIYITAKYCLKFFNHFNKFKQAPGSLILKRH